MTIHIANVGAWLPTDPPRPCPELLTREEAIIYLRLDQLCNDPVERFTRMRMEGKIPAVKLARKLAFKRTDLDRVIEECSE